MALSTAYWINPYGEILEMKASKHITEVTKEPEKFGLTQEYINQKFAEAGEPVGFEGKAREVIMREVISHGYIRVRAYRSFWSVTINTLDNKTKSSLGAWAEIAKEDKQMGKFAPVKLLELKTDKMHNTTVNDIYFELYESSCLTMVSTISEFTIPQIGFKSYFLMS